MESRFPRILETIPAASKMYLWGRKASLRMQAFSEADELERGEGQFVSNWKLINTMRAFFSAQRPLCLPCFTQHPDYSSVETGLHQHLLCLLQCFSYKRCSGEVCCKRGKRVACLDHFRTFSWQGAFDFPVVLSQMALAGVPRCPLMLGLYSCFRPLSPCCFLID